MPVQKYYRKPFIIEAAVLTEKDLVEIAQWCNGKVKGRSITLPKIRDNAKPIDRQDRYSYAVLGDVIIKTNKGYMVMKGVDFDSKYAPATERG